MAKKGIGIRQAYAEDTELQENPKLTIITEEIVSGDVINEFLKIKGVTRVSIYWSKSAILAFSISLSSSSRISKSSSQASKDSLAASSVNFSIA